MQIIDTRYPVARKLHRCDASEYVREVISEGYFTLSELRTIVIAKRNGWMIQPRQVYYLQINKWGGDFNAFKAIPAMNELCIRYDLYPDE